VNVSKVKVGLASVRYVFQPKELKPGTYRVTITYGQEKPPAGGLNLNLLSNFSWSFNVSEFVIEPVGGLSRHILWLKPGETKKHELHPLHRKCEWESQDKGL